MNINSLETCYSVHQSIANNLSLNSSRTEFVIFKSKNKFIVKHLNFCIRGQKIKPSFQVKYLGIILQDALH